MQHVIDKRGSLLFVYGVAASWAPQFIVLRWSSRTFLGAIVYKGRIPRLGMKRAIKIINDSNACRTNVIVTLIYNKFYRLLRIILLLKVRMAFSMLRSLCSLHVSRLASTSFRTSIVAISLQHLNAVSRTLSKWQMALVMMFLWLCMFVIVMPHQT